MSHVSEQEPPTLAEIDQRIEASIAAEHQLMIDAMGEVLAQLQHDAEMRGPPGPSGPRGEEGPPANSQAVDARNRLLRGRRRRLRRRHVPGAARYRPAAVACPLDLPRCCWPRRQDHRHARHVRRERELSSSRRRRSSTAAASSRSRTRPVPARAAVGSSLPARASAALPARRASAARRAMRERAARRFETGRSNASATSRRP
jgi:hypothetical protein